MITAEQVKAAYAEADGVPHGDRGDYFWAPCEYEPLVALIG